MCLCFFSDASAQNPCDSTLVISGWVFSSEGDVVPASRIVNRNSGGGAFVELDGSFLLRACPGDTRFLGAIGYYSVERPVFEGMEKRMFKSHLNTFKLKWVLAEVLAPRTLNKFRDIETFGYDEKDCDSSVDAFSSPITFLYEQFSRVERSKRLVAELENTDRRRELLQELFSKYVDYDIIQLDADEFKAFAEFCDPG